MSKSEFKNVSKKRSAIMRSIKSRGTKIEIMMAQGLINRGLGFLNRNVRNLPGKPDIVFQDHRVAVFCDGDYWHGRNFSISKCRIRNNREDWIRKFVNNIRRDRRNNDELSRRGWVVLRYWESDIKKNLIDIIDEISVVLYSIGNDLSSETKLSRT
jgi:DNA mismatch endonuclease, patch repair protein